MSKRHRLVVPGLPHHATHRGNRRQNTFREDEDYEIYRRLLRKYSDRYALHICSYSLMPNHVHLIAVPDREEALADTVQSVDGTYATLFNGLYGTVGHLWQGRFFSCPMDEGHFWNAVRYVERNAVRAGLVGRAEVYPWSSAAGHCGLRTDPLLSNEWPFPNPIANWSGWLAGSDMGEDEELLRKNTQSGYPCASEDFVDRLEVITGRQIRPLKGGRPKNEEQTSEELQPVLKLSN